MMSAGNLALVEMREVMRKSGGREGGSSSVRQDSPFPDSQRGYSFSTLDDKDSEILSLARDCPITLLSISEKMDISFVECLERAKRLQRLGLLVKTDDSPRYGGLHLYVATRRKD